MAKQASLADRARAFMNPKGDHTFKPTKQNQQVPPQTVSGVFTEAPVPPTKKTSAYLREAYQSWSYAAIQAISREVASIDLILKQKKGTEAVEVNEHESLSLLHEANRFTTFYQLLEITQIYLELAGEAFWVLLRPENQPTGDILEIWPLRPDWFDIVQDDKEFIAGYKYRPPGLPDGIFFPKENIVHFKYPNPINPYRGKGSVEAAALAIDTDIFSAEWNRNFFFNSALPSIIFSTDQNLTKETLDRLKSSWDQNFKGRGNAHKTGWLTAGLKPEKLSNTQKEADFLEQRKQVRDEILAVFGVPKSVVGVTEDVNRANAEASKAVFLENTITPRMIRLVSHLNEFYLRQFDGTEGMFFDFENPAPTDIEGRIKIYESGKDSWLTVNEIREDAGFDPIDGGDVIYKPLNLLPQIGADKQEPGTEESTRMIKLQSKPKKTKKKGVMPIPPKRIAEIRNKKKLEGIKPDFIKLMSTLMSNKTPKRITKDLAKEIKTEAKGTTPSGWTQSAKDRLWEQKIARTDVQEKVFKQKLIEIFKQQEERTLTDLNKIRYWTSEAKKSAVVKQFNVASENKVMVGVLMPFIKEFMIEEGNNRLFLLGANQSFDNATDNSVRFIRGNGAKFIKSINTTTQSSIRNVLAEGLANEESIPQLRNRVRGVFTEASKARATAIARTEVSRAANFGALEAYIQSGIVQRKEWLTARDERVDPWCASMDGKTITLKGSFFKEGESLTVEGRTLPINFGAVLSPPLHVNCRCDLIPIVE